MQVPVAGSDLSGAFTSLPSQLTVPDTGAPGTLRVFQAGGPSIIPDGLTYKVLIQIIGVGGKITVRTRGGRGGQAVPG